jgi:hypothetical protein
MADNRNTRRPRKGPHNATGLLELVLALASRLSNGMSEEGRVAVCALIALPAAGYFGVDSQFSFWLTFLALGGYLSVRLLRFAEK